jgi:signal transduction histidine kinase
VLAPFRSGGIRPYVIGIVGVVIATLFRQFLSPNLGEHLSFSFDYLAVFIAAWTGGIWPAVVTAVISALVSNYYFTAPHHSLAIVSMEEFLEMTFFLLVSVVIGVLSEVSLRLVEQLKKAQLEKDNFVATVAHELRSPLSVIYYANSLNRMSATEQPSDQNDVIERQVKHLNLLVEDLLDVSRVARGKIRLSREHVDAATVVDGAIEKSRPLIDSHRHALKVDISPEPMPLFVDPVRIEQVITNLLVNAAKYTPDGGEITVRAEADGDSAILTVRDNGIGISGDMLPHVFDLFVQGPRGQGRDEGGLGIGLALARKIAEMHGGSVRAKSAGANRGSEFTVTVPLEQPAEKRLQNLLSS